MFDTRRRFLLACGGAAAWTGWAIRDQAAEPTGALHTVKRTAQALGSRIELTLVHADPQRAAAAAEKALAELHLVERLMSIYQPESEISRLNRERRLEQPHPYVVQVLAAAAQMSRRTDGAFDITVQPLWQLYRDAQQAGQLPDASAIHRARQAVDWRRVRCEPSAIALDGDDTAITLNGIAQGFAADQLSRVLGQHGVTRALINTGEIGAAGLNASGQAWTIGIQHPRREDAFISLARLADRCLATSGDYATTFSDDRQHHHLFDPHTGQSPQELSSVSVAAAKALDADALSTAVFVLGARRGLELIRATPGADALLITKSGTVLATDGFPLASVSSRRGILP